MLLTELVPETYLSMRNSPQRQDLRPGRPRFINSGYFTPLLIAVLCCILLAVSWERGRGNFHRLTTAVLSDAPPPAHATGPGGEDVIHLTRTANAGAGTSEFVSATLLPGRGMNMLQLVARVPGHGEIPLLMAPSLDAAGKMLTGTGPDTNGALSATMGGAFLVPWAGRLQGRPSGTPGTLQTLWLGQHLTFPAMAPGSSLSTMGLLLDRGADATRNDVVLDGSSVDAVFHPGTFSGNWPSTGAVHMTVELSGRSVDLTVAVQNTGSTPMPVGVGWLPFFSLASQDRAHATLALPSSTRLETNRSTGIPTGRMVSVSGTPLDFSRARGTELGHAALDETYVRLSTAPLANGPVAELRDTAWGYGLRVLPLSANIKALRVMAPADKTWVAIGPNTNLDDALGSEWDTVEGSGISTLQPGDSLQWKVRVEIFSFRTGDGGNN